MRTFTSKYWKVVSRVIAQNPVFEDNFDIDRYGKADPVHPGVKSVLLNIARSSRLVTLFRAIRFVFPHLSELNWIADRLADVESKDLLAQLTAYRALGPRKIKLPLNNPEHWNNLDKAKSLPLQGETLSTNFLGRVLEIRKLETIGYPIRVYAKPGSIVSQFIEQQYRCTAGDTTIEVQPGDVVVDGGSCYGDTALYFAHLAGPTGRVAAFEFSPDNLDVMQKNLDLNPDLKSRIEIFPFALWSQSNKRVTSFGLGPGARISPDENGSKASATAAAVKTAAIDDLVNAQRLPKVDFIKMDIEGAELAALHGATQTIRQFRPRLAISVYHSFRDFWEIPRFVDGLNLGYQFYLRHFTIHNEETVLFGIAR